MARYYGVTGWLECDVDYAEVLDEELEKLNERFAFSDEWLPCVKSWTRPKDNLNLLAYFTFASHLRLHELENFVNILQRFCDLQFGLYGFFYVHAETDADARHLKVENDKLTVTASARLLFDVEF